jgi:hypothetical protein
MRESGPTAPFSIKRSMRRNFRSLWQFGVRVRILTVSGMVFEREWGLQMGQREGGREHCLLLIPAPSDAAIYEIFRSLASRWRSRLLSQQLWIEGDLPLTPGLTEAAVPQTMTRLLDADCAIIDKIELQFAALRITYVRSGGHAPFRESYFDEVRLEASATSLSSNEVRAIVESTLRSLPVASYSASPGFAELIEDHRPANNNLEPPSEPHASITQSRNS